MATLLLRLQGPMQSWGTTSQFDERDTQLEPSKSGVLGLICAALGRDRSESVDDLAQLHMAVRVDREGMPMRDYHTATGAVIAATGKPDRNRTVVSNRYYLSDAIFLVALEGDKSLLSQIQESLKAPYWPLSLGRKSLVPSMPIQLPDGLVDQNLWTALQNWPSLESTTEKRQAAGRKTDNPEKYRVVMESKTEGSMRLDQPVTPFSEHQFGPRLVTTYNITLENNDVFEQT